MKDFVFVDLVARSCSDMHGLGICQDERCLLVFMLLWFYFRTPPRNLDKRTTITIDEKTFVVEADDLETLCVLGRGAYGIVDKMRHKQSGTIMAVKVFILNDEL